MAETYLIIADGFDSVANMQDRRKAQPDLDIEILRGWLKYLGITRYDVAWSRDAKLTAWQGPVLALGDAAHAAAVKLGKRVYKLPHPTKRSKTIQDPVKMKAILDSVHMKMQNKPRQKFKKVVVLK